MLLVGQLDAGRSVQFTKKSGAGLFLNFRQIRIYLKDFSISTVGQLPL
jgi:hypothetical protein